jgi:hypothetical protein
MRSDIALLANIGSNIIFTDLPFRLSLQVNTILKMFADSNQST